MRIFDLEGVCHSGVPRHVKLQTTYLRGAFRNTRDHAVYILLPGYVPWLIGMKRLVGGLRARSLQRRLDNPAHWHYLAPCARHVSIISMDTSTALHT